MIVRDRIRAAFPALAGDTVYLENAGGSQVPAVVADAIRRYMRETYVQLGAGYAIADESDAVVERAHAYARVLMNAEGRGNVMLGPSCTQLITMLAGCYAEILEPGDEIVVTEAGHEANVGPWTRLASRGAVIRTWPVDPEAQTCTLETLAPLLNERTRVVAVVHVSNLLGEINDVAAIARLVHDAGARIVVDGVAYAPHRAIDVAAWDVDWYAYSTYKVYGPHLAALYGRRDAIEELPAPNHFFIPREEVEYAFELGGANHEACAGLLALEEYLQLLASMCPAPSESGGGEAIGAERRIVVDAFATMTECELPVQRRLIEYLADKPTVSIVGPSHTGAGRVGTVSFTHAAKSSQEICAAAHARNIGIRNGHMYAYRLCTALGIEPEDGVVRVSLVHYNTVEEIDRLIDLLETVL